ncbi:hypothetical protein [Nocardioides caldifontis]|uniref:hypothetical protein n=1 Tax=Nocardioides caldifontis TaxID=2588938 RepID=UPI0011DF7C48|nr:hypothetical protein [Nocardioides caldifontis]
MSSGAAAFAVVLVTVLVWWLLSGNGPQGPDGSADQLGVADDATAPQEPSGGGSAPSKGADEQPSPDEDGSVEEPQRSDRGVRIDGYVLEAPDRLALNYTTGVPACHGRLDTPSVVEDAGGVTITLSTVPPAEPADTCIEIAVRKTVRVTLESPLGGRGVLDGSATPRVRVERMAKPYE